MPRPGFFHCDHTFALLLGSERIVRCTKCSFTRLRRDDERDEHLVGVAS